MTISVLYKAPAPLGETKYMIDGVVAPAQFQPTITVSTSRNKAGTNTMWTLHGEYPILVEQGGIQVNNDTFRIKFEFTSLRGTISTTERTALINEVLTFLSLPANKTAIANGSAITSP